MSYLVLARKFRPQTFADVIQQDHVTQTLTNAISSGRVAHAILFSGPRGTGKTTIARILAKAMNCRQGPTPTPCNVCRSCKEITAGNAADVYEIDGASNNGVEQVRELRDNIKYMPAHSPYKIYIIDEVHMLSTAAFNALLKTLEEPPDHVLFFFATTEPHKIPITILSRCQRHDLRRIDLKAVVDHLARLCAMEQVSFPEETLWLIARETGGSMRDALSLLDQIISCTIGPIHHEHVLGLLGAVDTQTFFRLSKAALNRNPQELLAILGDAYDRGRDLKKLYSDLVGHFRNLLIVKIAKNPTKLVDLSVQDLEEARLQIQSVSHTELIQMLGLLMKEEPTLRFAAQPRLAMEMMFIRLGITEPALPIEDLIDGLDRLREDIFKLPAVGIGERPLPGIGRDMKNIPASEIDALPGTALSSLSSEAFLPLEPEANHKGDSPESLDRAWQDILNRISKNYPPLAAYLAVSTPVSLLDNTLTLEVSGTEFNLHMVQRDKNRNILKEVCSGYFGRPVSVELATKVIDNGDNQEKKDIQLLSKNQALKHSLVGEVIEIFNGKVVDVKLVPE